MPEQTEKISALPTTTNSGLSDYLVVVANVAGTLTTKKITHADFFTNSSANVHIVTTTPANSTIVVKAGTLLYDTNYLYVAVSNNVLKRVALSSF